MSLRPVAAWRSANVCTNCGGPRPGDFAWCDDCRAKRRARVNRIRAARRARALCPMCAGATEPGFVLCAGCRVTPRSARVLTAARRFQAAFERIEKTDAAGEQLALRAELVAAKRQLWALLAEAGHAGPSHA